MNDQIAVRAVPSELRQGQAAAQLSPWHVLDGGDVGTPSAARTRCGLVIRVDLLSVMTELAQVDPVRRCKRHGCRQAWWGAPRTSRPRTV